MSTDLRVQFVQAPARIRLAGPVARRRGGSGSGAGKSAERSESDPSGSGPGKPGNEDEAPARDPHGRSSEDSTDVAAEGVEAESADPEAADPGGPVPDASGGVADPVIAQAQAVPPEWMHLQNRFLELISELERQAERRHEEMESELRSLTPAVVDLALAIAGRVLNTEFDSGRVDVAPMIEEALAKMLSGVDDEGPIRARVGSEIEDVARSVLGARLGDSERFHLVVDHGLPGRAVELQCDMRRVTVDWKQALQRLSDHMRGGLDV